MLNETAMRVIKRFPSTGIRSAITMGASKEVEEYAYEKAVEAVGKIRADQMRYRAHLDAGNVDYLEADNGEEPKREV